MPDPDIGYLITLGTGADLVMAAQRVSENDSMSAYWGPPYFTILIISLN